MNIHHIQNPSENSNIEFSVIINETIGDRLENYKLHIPIRKEITGYYSKQNIIDLFF